MASWRGAFSGPLGCSQCPLIWCSRCLTNIYEECHDDAFRMRDFALNLLLCRWRVLSPDAVADLKITPRTCHLRPETG